jgi:hypothetical protein
MTAANDDIETFEANKESKKGSFSFKEIFNFSSVKRRTWKADCKEKNCEELSPFALRWR